MGGERLMLARDCKVGTKVRVVGKATLREFPKCEGAVGLISEVRDPGDQNFICVTFRRVIHHPDWPGKHLWLPPRDLGREQ
jgi:hypothetical protein